MRAAGVGMSAAIWKQAAKRLTESWKFAIFREE
jgi:hypothetical protein